MSSKMTVAALSILALTGAAHGAITGTTGQVTQIGAPPSALFGAIVGTPASAWDEQQGFFNTGLPVDLSINPSSSNAPTAGIIAGGPVDSHIIHWNDFSGIAISGTVSFNGPIIGVAYSDNFLDVSDAVAGAGGTTYPTFFPFRGVIPSAAQGNVISINASTLSFNLNLIPGIVDFDQIRVYTRVVPAPGAGALLAGAGLLGARRRRR
jgi:hypothetical protein